MTQGYQMMSLLRGGRRFGAVVLALGLLVASTSNVFAHARYDRSEPASGSALDGSPFVLKAWFSQELTSKSTIRVIDANGVQVDLGDGRVDLDDPIRKMMVVSVPELPPGLYTVRYEADSAEDGHLYPGAFAFGVGMEAPAGELPSDQPSGGSSPLPVDNAEAMVLDAY
jgi:methionine-rich copper-binding protein CopC